MKKISIIILVLVVAVGALGIGYASWTDTVTITGYVQTGTVDLEVVDTSNTRVWKVPGAVSYNETFVEHYWESGTNSPGYPDWFDDYGTPILVGWADGDYEDQSYGMADPPGGTDTVELTFWNAFPIQETDAAGNVVPAFKADFLLHYAGSIPVKVQVAELGYQDYDVGGLLEYPYEAPTANWTLNAPNSDIADAISIKYYEADVDDGVYIIGDEIVDGIMGDQWEYCQYMYVVVYVDLPQDDAYMLQSGYFSGRIQVVQWNEYVEPD